jgi:2-hydroxychromene-2-carboxylate isomerase
VPDLERARATGGGAQPGAGARNLASTSDPPWLARRLTSAVVRVLSSPRTRESKRRRAERRRLRSGEPHRVEYFHEADDPYSHLAAQALGKLAAAYDIELVPQLAIREAGTNAPEPELLAAYARRDAAAVAPHQGLAFPGRAPAPAPEQVQLAQRILAAAAPRDFAERAVRVGRALWSDDKDGLAALARELPVADEGAARALAAAGAARRAKLGHYSGATFFYAGEWYWGVDRLCHLEPRLAALGARRAGVAGPVAPRPAVDPGPVRDRGRLTLEVFPSLRSPYTAVGFDLALALAERAGVRVVLRPVLPMVMRGVPVTLTKGRYIFTDAVREAELAGVPYGRFVDPIGRPVEAGFSLFPWARDRGRGAALISAFLRAAFAEGVDTSRPSGLRRVVESAGLPWSEAQAILGNTGWRDELERNRRAMYDEMGLWGVPSFRLMGPAGEPDFSTWGQDRLWLVAAEMRRRLQAAAGRAQ